MLRYISLVVDLLAMTAGKEVEILSSEINKKMCLAPNYKRPSILSLTPLAETREAVAPGWVCVRGPGDTQVEEIPHR